MKVLYLTNIRVPYRVRFFNELAKGCELTVVYEKRDPKGRNQTWANGEAVHFRVRYLHPGFLRSAVELKRELRSDYDAILVGCINTPLQMLAICLMKLWKQPYILNLDGEPFLNDKNLKGAVKRWLVSGASLYLTAGEKAAASVRPFAKGSPTIAYPFGSMTRSDMEAARKNPKGSRSDTVLVAARNLPCKGLDVALECARKDAAHPWLFVGMGERNIPQNLPPNVTAIPFLQKEDLFTLYRQCAMVVLPSRRECWGLVLPEAAAFGAPIISTWGSGAGRELLADQYPQFLAQPGDADSLRMCMDNLRNMEEQEAYCRYLQEKAETFTIETCAAQHLYALKQWEKQYGSH